MTPEERAIRDAIFKHPLFLPQEAKDWLVDYAARNTPKLPITQVQGFRLLNAKSATQAASATRSSSSYGDLSDGEGPKISNMADGFYLLLFGAERRNRNAVNMFVGLSFNGGAIANDDNAIFYGQFAKGSGGRAVVVELRGDNKNSVALKYRGSNATQIEASRRYIHALRVVEHE